MRKHCPVKIWCLGNLILSSVSFNTINKTKIVKQLTDKNQHLDFDLFELTWGRGMLETN